MLLLLCCFFFSSRRRHTRCSRDWSSDVCSSDLVLMGGITSASREAVRPVVGKYKQVYFYNEQYEGGVCDKLVFCTGVTPAQQLGTLIPWAVKEYGKKVYTLAADYNYGHISADWGKGFLGKAGGH